MKVELFPFQKIALNKLRTFSAEALGGYQRTRTPQVVSFTAPTGAGKTIIMASFIESVYFGNELYPEQQEAIFVWLSDSPQLNEQSKMKIDLKADKIRLNQCVTISEESFDAEYLEDGKIYFTEDEENWVELPEEVNVSMNCWCFPSSFIDEIEEHFKKFLDDALVNNPLKGEFYLPFIVKDMLAENKCTVKVLETTAKWFGVTYREDKPAVVESFRQLIDAGVYVTPLFA